MINHQYKCIFIHVPRAAGTSVEIWINGIDQWDLDKRTKHLTASQAKRLYSEYWDEYFKFTIIRNPWARMVSCAKFPRHFGVRISRSGHLDIRKYKKKFGYPKTLECDYRFYSRNEFDLEKVKTKSVYQNIIDEPIDYVGLFEELPEVTLFLQDQLKIPTKFPQTKHIESKFGGYQNYYDRSVQEEVEDLYLEDIKKWGFCYGGM